MQKARSLRLAAVVAPIPEEASVPPRIEKVSLSLTIPSDLHYRLRMESMMREQSVGEIIEEIVDQNVSPEALTLTAEDLMGPNDSDEPVISGIEMKGLSSPISRRHHALIRLESLRRKCSIRTLIRSWLQESIRDWIVEPVNQQGRRASAPQAVAS